MGDKILIEVDSDLEDFVPSYLEARNEDIGTIADALKQGDFALIQSIGHKMKGSGGGYGFDFISECGLNIEKLSMEENKTEIEGWVERLSEYLSNIEVRYVELDE